MKGCKLILVAVMVAGVASLGTVSPVLAQEKQGAPEIVKAVVGTGVENLEPKGVAESFPASTEKVYCFIEAKNISKDTDIAFVWSLGDKEMLKFKTSLKAGAKWRTYANKNVRGKKGDWKVEIKDAGGKVLKEVKFKVE